MIDLAAVIPVVAEIAVGAGEKIMQVYNSANFEVTAKDDSSPLTAADLAAHRFIVTELARLTPDIPVLSEESETTGFDQRRRWPTYWLVDPLDGTKEFIKRNGEFTVNIALVRGHELDLGVVHVPATGVTYSAARGHGCWRRDAGSDPLAIRVQTQCPEVVRVVGSRSHAGASLMAFVGRLERYELLSIGSSLKLCMVADGRADIYPRLGPTSEWDTAAAQCVVEQAGGRVVTLDGQALRYNTKESLLNPFFMVFADDSRDWLSLLPADV